MAVMKWGTPPSGNSYDRQAHVVGHGEGVSLVHAVRGEKVGGGGNQDTSDPNHGPATKWSTAPYRGPAIEDTTPEQPNPWGYRSPKREKRCMANNDTCKAFATKASGYEFCYPHSRQAQGKLAWSPNEPKPKDLEADLFGSED
jgi:hypothetical protein